MTTNSPFFGQAESPSSGHSQVMLIEIYIEALLVDDELADQDWEAWDGGEIDDFEACVA